MKLETVLNTFGIVFKRPIPKLPEFLHKLIKKFPTPPVVSSYNPEAPFFVLLKNFPTPSVVSL